MKSEDRVWRVGHVPRIVWDTTTSQREKVALETDKVEQLFRARPPGVAHHYSLKEWHVLISKKHVQQ